MQRRPGRRRCIAAAEDGDTVTTTEHEPVEPASLTGVHQPARPSWDCLGCGESWPCQQVRSDLLSGTDSFSMSIYAAVMMHEAIGDLPKADPAALWERFLAWTRTPDARVDSAC
ncbi:hypothetical protein [Actinoplanes sp. NPDC051859]|uniref:hypothetical protein n=1 Tax=Actinoplanes sp. NPDC051859 TaxID=3363909 RepID=UPI0037BAC28C